LREAGKPVKKFIVFSKLIHNFFITYFYDGKDPGTRIRLKHKNIREVSE
jgi:hypothetical protein